MHTESKGQRSLCDSGTLSYGVSMETVFINSSAVGSAAYCILQLPATTLASFILRMVLCLGIVTQHHSLILLQRKTMLHVGG